MTIFFTKSENFENEGSFTKGELISFLAALESGEVEDIQVIEIVLDEGTARDVTTDIAAEMATAFEFHEFDGDLSSENVPAFILLHCEDELRDRLAGEMREARVVASDQRLFQQEVA